MIAGAEGMFDGADAAADGLIALHAPHPRRRTGALGFAWSVRTGCAGLVRPRLVLPSPDPRCRWAHRTEVGWRRRRVGFDFAVAPAPRNAVLRPRHGRAGAPRPQSRCRLRRCRPPPGSRRRSRRRQPPYPFRRPRQRQLRAAGNEAVGNAGPKDREAEHRQGREDQSQRVVIVGDCSGRW